MIGSCVGNCVKFGPPPDFILSMPPPPLPSFLLPKAATLTFALANESNPCFASTVCEPNPHPRESGFEFVELTSSNNKGIENTWLFVLITSCVGVLMLGGLLAVIVLKCRDTLFSSCSLSYNDSNIKQSAMPVLGEPSKTNSLMTGGILYPCAPSNNRDHLQSGLANDSRFLWATLTPHGTRHYISDYPMVPNSFDGNYEIVDYRNKSHSSAYREYSKHLPVKSFDNNGFTDYDHEDPTPLMDSYHDDIDSGYQEPQEVIGTLPRSSPRPIVSSPTNIENPNIPPLNYYPSHRNICINVQTSNNSNSLNRKRTINRRISDAFSHEYNSSDI